MCVSADRSNISIAEICRSMLIFSKVTAEVSQELMSILPGKTAQLKKKFFADAIASVPGGLTQTSWQVKVEYSEDRIVVFGDWDDVVAIRKFLERWIQFREIVANETYQVVEKTVKEENYETEETKEDITSDVEPDPVTLQKYSPSYMPNENHINVEITCSDDDHQDNAFIVVEQEGISGFPTGEGENGGTQETKEDIIPNVEPVTLQKYLPIYMALPNKKHVEVVTSYSDDDHEDNTFTNDEHEGISGIPTAETAKEHTSGLDIILDKEIIKETTTAPFPSGGTPIPVIAKLSESENGENDSHIGSIEFKVNEQKDPIIVQSVFAVVKKKRGRPRKHTTGGENKVEGRNIGGKKRGRPQIPPKEAKIPKKQHEVESLSVTKDILGKKTRGRSLISPKEPNIPKKQCEVESLSVTKDILEKKKRGRPRIHPIGTRLPTKRKPPKYELCSCPECGFETTNRKNLSDHIKGNHGEKIYKCSICGKMFCTKTRLNMHVKYHTGFGTFCCDVCGVTFSSNVALQSHLFRIHDGPQPKYLPKTVLCITCGKLCRNAEQHKAHCNKEHNKISPYKCDTCGKEFYGNALLRTHIREVHNLAYDQQCNVCGKLFKRPSSLNAHKVIHNAERPYKCEICEKGFTQKCALKRHRRIHTGEKPFKCCLCDSQFNANSILRRHLQGVHKITDLEEIRKTIQKCK